MKPFIYSYVNILVLLRKSDFKNCLILMPKKPIISIITVVYNCVDLLSNTIKSVADQTYPNVEYIIVDGGSSDGTVEVIEKYANHISQWIREPDKGLYDAMNKGLKMATGDFVWFMNAGDHIYASDTLEKMINKWQPDTDILYGEVMLVDETRKELGTRTATTKQKLTNPLHWKDLAKGMVVCHQGFLPRRTLAPFYIENNLTADIDWVIKCLKASKQTTATELTVASYLVGGLSKQQHQRSLKDRYWVLKEHFGFWPNLWNHLQILLRRVF